MLNSLDIALLCDSRTVDGAGLAITPDRSRHGIHAQLGDGATAGTMPTLDALNGRFTFDGGDYMVLRQADDVDDVLADMGSIQDETYIFVVDPVIVNSQNQYMVGWNTAAATSVGYIIIRNTNVVRMALGDAGGLTEVLDFDIAALHGHAPIFAWVREPAHGTAKQRLYIDAVERATANQTARDARNPVNKFIGSSSVGTAMLQAGTGLRFFGYEARAWTQTQLSALQRFLRGNL